VKSPPHVDATVEQSLSAAAQVSADETPPPQMASPISGQISSEVMQQLEIAARNLAALQQSIAELAAKQEEMSSNIAKLQAADRENRQKIATARKKVLLAPQQPPSPAPTSPAVVDAAVVDILRDPPCPHPSTTFGTPPIATGDLKNSSLRSPSRLQSHSQISDAFRAATIMPHTKDPRRKWLGSFISEPI
jgi:hypothetical protein